MTCLARDENRVRVGATRVALFSVENSPTLTSYWAETDVISGPHWEVMEPRKMEDENMT
jgi:hypothetical protein